MYFHIYMIVHTHTYIFAEGTALCTFDDLIAGTHKGYACDCAIGISGKEFNAVEAALKLITHTKECLNKIDAQRGPDKIQKFYVGKAFITEGKSRFDCLDSKTWIKDGISSRWREHRKQSYGEDGMFVLAAISRESLPPKTTTSLEIYALTLEQKLIHHFMTDEPDERLHNKTVSSGGPDGKTSIAYTIYIAYGTTVVDTASKSSASTKRSLRQLKIEEMWVH